MGLLGGRHSFRASALSMAVPLEGTETVVGLRELQRRRDGLELAKALKLNALAGGGKPKAWRQRYRGPFLRDLAGAHLHVPARDWRAVLFGQGWHSYNLPEGLDHLCERAEENAMTYLPNYLRLLLLLLLLAMCLRPWSLLGAAAIAGLTCFRAAFRLPQQQRGLPLRQRCWAVVEAQWEAVRAHAQALQQPEAQGAPARPQRRSQPSEAAGADPLGSLLLVACYAAVLYSSLLGTLLRGGWRAAWLLAGHACLRRSPSEYRQALRHPDIAAGRAAAVSGHPGVPGVAFTQALGVAGGSSPDPRRVFREAWQLLSGIGSAAGAYGWHAAQFYGHKAWQRLRASVPSLQLA